MIRKFKLNIFEYIPLLIFNVFYKKSYRENFKMLTYNVEMPERVVYMQNRRPQNKPQQEVYKNCF